MVEWSKVNDGTKSMYCAVGDSYPPVWKECRGDLEVVSTKANRTQIREEMKGLKMERLRRKRSDMPEMTSRAG